MSNIVHLDNYRKTPRGMTRHEKAVFIADSYVIDPDAARRRREEITIFEAWRASFCKELEK